MHAQGAWLRSVSEAFEVPLGYTLVAVVVVAGAVEPRGLRAVVGGLVAQVVAVAVTRQHTFRVPPAWVDTFGRDGCNDGSIVECSCNTQ